MKYVPAGFSRSKNKPYSAFWSCDARSGGCGATARADAEPSIAENSAATDRLASIERKLDEILGLLKAM